MPVIQKAMQTCSPLNPKPIIEEAISYYCYYTLSPKALKDPHPCYQPEVQPKTVDMSCPWASGLGWDSGAEDCEVTSIGSAPGHQGVEKAGPRQVTLYYILHTIYYND